MTVNAICNHNVATIDEHADIVEAAAMMREAHVGDLVVIAQHAAAPRPIGIITDRDIVVGVVAKKIAPNEVAVRDVISGELLAVHEQSGLEHALERMHRAGVRRAPVVNTDGELVGVLSIDDVIDHLAVQLGHIAGAIRLEQDVESRRRT